ncbi:mycofactocin-coupled SDR family oxidoreductase [Actinomyces polynesiensis]|uniref:mycofactocin-coupled SDR family oxidoreductase n=1 Tax=Actinomyces polynesiensis TaxID=1325934 RepID=UPI0006932D74|nr:mycofactocin-coupled SDR family oxidoreductase [Actinomyces polynesiensis]
MPEPVISPTPTTEDFTGKVVFITGAGSGQGRAAALAFARNNAAVVGFDLDRPLSYPAYVADESAALESLGEEIEANGGQFLAATGDVREAADLEAAVSAALARFGRIDVLFNNAGVGSYARAVEMTEDQWDAVLDINLKGAWLTARAVIPTFVAQRSGVIINNSSVAGLRGFANLSHYVASKWGLVGLTKSWAIELAPHGVRVVSIHPTGVNSAFNDGLAEQEGSTPREIAERSAGNLLPVPWVEVDDVAELVLFLASDRARYITGSQVPVDAGLLTR